MVIHVFNIQYLDTEAFVVRTIMNKLSVWLQMKERERERKNELEVVQWSVLQNFLRSQLISYWNKQECLFAIAIHFHPSLIFAGKANNLPLKWSA